MKRPLKRINYTKALAKVANEVGIHEDVMLELLKPSGLTAVATDFFEGEMKNLDPKLIQKARDLFNLEGDEMPTHAHNYVARLFHLGLEKGNPKIAALLGDLSGTSTQDKVSLINAISNLIKTVNDSKLAKARQDKLENDVEKIKEIVGLDEVYNMIVPEKPKRG